MVLCPQLGHFGFMDNWYNEPLYKAIGSETERFKYNHPIPIYIICEVNVVWKSNTAYAETS